MKKSYYFLAGMALLGLMTGCSNELDEPGVNPNGDVVRIMFEAPEALQVTRAVTGTNSAQGGLTNVDWSKYDLRSVGRFCKTRRNVRFALQHVRFYQHFDKRWA